MKIKQNIISAVCFMFALLFVWDMDVEASASTSWTWCFNTPVNSFTRDYQINCGIDEAVYNDSTNLVYFYKGGTDTITIDTGAMQQITLNTRDYLFYDGARLKMQPQVIFNLLSQSFNNNDYSSDPVTYVDIRPYAIVYGEKYYLDNYAYNDIVLDTISDDLLVSFGCEVDVQIASDMWNSSGTYLPTGTLYSSTRQLSFSCSDVEFIGYKKISSGEQTIIDKLQSTISEISWQTTFLGQKLDSVVNKLAGFLGSTDLINQFISTRNKMVELYNGFVNWGKTWNSNITLKLDEVVSAINGDSIDKEATDSVTTEMETTFTELTNSNKEVTDTATANLISFTMPDNGFEGYGTTFVSAVTLVSGMMQSIFTASGDFSILVAIVFGLTIASMLVGLYKFIKV